MDRKRKYYIANKDAILKRTRAYYKEHRDEQLANMKTYYKKHRDIIVDRASQWVKDNRERFNAARRLKYKNHPERRLNENQSRRAREKSEAANCTAKIALLKLERFCRWCCTGLTRENMAIDHIIPISRGGKHVSNNLAASCRRCNCSRGNKLIAEWLPNVILCQT